MTEDQIHDAKIAICKLRGIPLSVDDLQGESSLVQEIDKRLDAMIMRALYAGEDIELPGQHGVNFDKRADPRKSESARIGAKAARKLLKPFSIKGKTD